MKALPQKIGPYLTAPPVPQLFETNSPLAVFSSEITEVYRIKVEGGGSRGVVDAAWGAYVAALVKGGLDVKETNGSGVGNTEDLFVGILGWESSEVCYTDWTFAIEKGFADMQQARSKALEQASVADAKSKIENLRGVSSFVTALEYSQKVCLCNDTRNAK